MKIAVASGKGGTGKTTIAVNLAFFNSKPLFDLDVEEPNAKVFIRGKTKEKTIYRPVPEVKDNCTLCGTCKDVCQYNAIIMLKDTVVIFPEICHSCGACVYLCPEDAIVEKSKSIGKVVEVDSSIKLIYGELEIGEVSPVPLIKAVKKEIKNEAVMDCPPGVSCPMVESVRDSDFVVLVAEPSPLSYHDLKLAAEVVSEFGKPYGVVINKYGLPYNIEEKCKEKGYEILGKIPFSKENAEKYSKGELLDMETEFQEIYDKIRNFI